MLIHRPGTGMNCTVLNTVPLAVAVAGTCLPKEGKRSETHHSRRPQHILLQFSKFTVTINEQQTNKFKSLLLFCSNTKNK
jgi:hypothetical protein